MPPSSSDAHAEEGLAGRPSERCHQPQQHRVPLVKWAQPLGKEALRLLFKVAGSEGQSYRLGLRETKVTFLRPFASPPPFGFFCSGTRV